MAAALRIRAAARLAMAVICLAGVGSGLRAAEAPRLEPVNCWFEVGAGWPQTQCYFMHVPERRGDPASPTIKFPVVRFRTPETNPERPVLHLGGGGPGQALGLERDQIDETLFERYRFLSLEWAHELIMIDPRGVGMAEPRLTCPELAAAVPSLLAVRRSVEDEQAAGAKLFGACFARLRRDGIDPSAYHSRAVAADVEALRKALDVERWNLYGISYASRYALTIAREYPATVAAMVLDGPVFPQVRYIEKSPSDFAAAFARSLAPCAGNSACATRFPDIEARFWRLVEALDADPLVLSVTHPTTFARLPVVMDGSRFVRAVFTGLYDEVFAQALPELIASLEHRNVDLVAGPVRAWLAQQINPGFADALAAAHYCVEEHPFVDYARALERAAHIVPVLRRISVADLQGRRADCRAWRIESGPASEGLPVRTGVPTLVLQGALDPVLPIEDLRDAMTHFERGVPLVFEGVAHDVVGADPCAEEAAGVFFALGLDFRSEVDCL